MFRAFFAAVLTSSLMVLSPAAAHCAQAYPSKTIHLVCHTKPGSGMDALMRLMGKILEERLKVPTVVENKPGGGSSVAMSYVATAKNPDYVLHGISNIQLTTPLTNKVPYNMSSLRPISFLFEDPLVLFVRPDSPWKNADDFLKAAKANPGKYTMGVAQVGSVDYLTVTYYPRKGYPYEVMTTDSASETLTSVLGGHVDIGIVEPSIAVQQAKAGKIRVLCSFTDERLQSLPDVPTMKELGYPSVSMRQFRGIVMPGKASDKAVKFMTKEIQDIIQNDKTFIEYCKSNEMVIKVMSTANFIKYMDGMTQETKSTLEQLGMIKK